MPNRFFSSRWLTVAFVSALSGASANAEPIELSLEEFKMYRQYKNAMEDSRVQAMKPEQRLPAIAEDARFKVKDLKVAVAHGEAAGDLKARCEGSLREVLGQGGV